jgi:two-component system, cell cycle sensor histidine kinase and response regulator CckA
MKSHPDSSWTAQPGELHSKDSPITIEAKQSILVVDDEEVALNLAKRTLSNAGFQVTTAQSGFECLDLFRRRARGYDLVLLDLIMPLMDGEETFERLREICPELPVIIYTGFGQQERLNRLMEAGLAGSLRKPIAPDEMVADIRSILESVRYSRDSADPGDMSATV